MAAILKIKDQDGNIIEIPAIKGDSYVITEADKQEIANMIMNMIEGGDEEEY